jgi:hypothetical protein
LKYEESQGGALRGNGACVRVRDRSGDPCRLCGMVSIMPFRAEAHWFVARESA